MSNEVIERVARAICLQFNLDDGYADNSVLRGSIEMGMWRNHVSQARAAIAAMREPSEAMVSAGQEEELSRTEDVKAIFSAMIDAALNEPRSE